jgi:hypothetical protein
MKREILEIPLEEIKLHLDTNVRQDIKVIATSILSDELYKRLIDRGKILKKEIPLDGSRLKRSYKTKPNNICEAQDFDFDISNSKKEPFTISFDNEKAEQEEHFHKLHTEIYFSEHPIRGYYRIIGNNKETKFELKQNYPNPFNPVTNITYSIPIDGMVTIKVYDIMGCEVFYTCK